MTDANSLIEQVARELYRTRFPYAPVDDHFEWFVSGKDDPLSCVHYSTVSGAYRDARAVVRLVVERCAEECGPKEGEAWERKALWAADTIETRLRSLLPPEKE